ncbi:MAG: hypothetical protein ACFE8B_10230 [Candidatus Hermodarchaeota archaeon]
MSSDTELSRILTLFECPFYPTCSLPKITFLCKIPECRNCSEYDSKLVRINHDHEF